MPPRWTNRILLLCSVLFTLLVLEAGLRLLKDRVPDRNFHLALMDRGLLRSAYPAEHDDVLGWIPRAGISGTGNLWMTELTVLEDGIRSNGTGGSRDARSPAVLAVGDSYTFGDEVSDRETWPAQLEARTGRRVINGGVFGYGLDQMFLRAMRLMEKHAVDTLIVGMIPDDILRCSMDVRSGAAKPFFAVVREDGQAYRIELRNVPVPRRETRIGFLRRSLGTSYLVNFVMVKVRPAWWLEGTFGESHEAHREPFRVAKALLTTLDALSAERRLRIILLVQHVPPVDPRENELVLKLLSSIRLRYLEVVNLYGPLTELKAQDPQRFGRFFTTLGGHMTAEGNAFVADLLAARIAQGGPAGRPVRLP